MELEVRIGIFFGPAIIHDGMNVRGERRKVVRCLDGLPHADPTGLALGERLPVDRVDFMAAGCRYQVIGFAGIRSGHSSAVVQAVSD